MQQATAQVLASQDPPSFLLPEHFLGSVLGWLAAALSGPQSHQQHILGLPELGLF